MIQTYCYKGNHATNATLIEYEIIFHCVSLNMHDIKKGFFKKCLLLNEVYIYDMCQLFVMVAVFQKTDKV
jgi:hypothetical protein